MAMILYRRGNLHRIKTRVQENQLEHTGNHKWQQGLLPVHYYYYAVSKMKII